MSWLREDHLLRYAWRLWRREGPRVLLVRTSRYLRVRIRRALGRPTRNYQRWLSRQRVTPAEIGSQRREAMEFAWKPRISFLTPTWNTPVAYLKQLIECLRGQSYDEWELCIADGASDGPELWAAIEKSMGEDTRIRAVRLAQNQGISGNTNAALALATGDFVAILDHDDFLEPDYSFHVVKALQATPDADVVYVDEDKATADGLQWTEPSFKPGWSPETLLSSNYLMHSIYRRRLVQELGGFDSSTDGSQDWDLAFRVTERAERIVHVPRVLYHWRMAPSSTARSSQAKPGVHKSQEVAIERHLERLRLPGPDVDAMFPGTIRSTWLVPPTKVSIVLYGPPGARPTPGDFAATAGLDLDLHVVEHGPGRPLGSALADVLKDCAGSVLVFLDDRLEPVSPDWLEELVRWALRPEIGAVTCQVRRPNGVDLQPTGLYLSATRGALPLHFGMQNHFGLFGSTTSYRNHVVLSGAVVAMRRDVLRAAGGFDRNLTSPVLFQILTASLWSHRRRNLFTPVVHLREREDPPYWPPTAEEQRRFRRVVARLQLDRDPYLHPVFDDATDDPLLLSGPGLEASFSR